MTPHPASSTLFPYTTLFRSHSCFAHADFRCGAVSGGSSPRNDEIRSSGNTRAVGRSEEHTSELQSRFDLVCRLLLEKKKQQYITVWQWRCCLPSPILPT